MKNDMRMVVPRALVQKLRRFDGSPTRGLTLN